MLFALLALLGTSSTVYLLLRLLWPSWYLDYLTLSALKKVGQGIADVVAKGLFIIDVFEQKAKEAPQRTFIIHNDIKYTYEYMDKKANQACRTGFEIGVKPGSIIAVLMNSEPGFIWTYLACRRLPLAFCKRRFVKNIVTKGEIAHGFMKAGYQIALINFNLRSKSLAHCINVSGAKVLVVGVGSQLAHNVEEILPDIPNVMVYYMGTIPEPKPAPFLSWDLVMSRASSAPIERSIRKHLTYKSTHVLIYTSGTTGLPKPAIVPHQKAINHMCSFKLTNMTADDVLYQVLPMYHSTGLLMGFSSVILNGASMVLVDKFSASTFWDDCRKYDVTIIQYIGEVCRYLVARPKSKDDGVHKIRVATGNGLRMDIWKEFQTRFKIPNIIEFYGATEGNAGFVNVTNKTGAIGIFSPFMSFVMPYSFVKYDLESQAPYRNKHGWCVPIQPGEVGLFIAPIVEGKLEFYGYHGNKKATDSKVLTDVFKRGDKYFNSGDLLRLDKDYHVYFNDRIGDTFRWKGENVSTTEVGNMLTDLEFIQDANVYGVMVPGGDGRAGMVAITLTDPSLTNLSRDMTSALSKHVNDALPVYARPKFARVRPELELTSTFKQQKTVLVKEGYDITQIQDPLYYLNPATKAYEHLDQAAYEQIMAGKIHF